jgi:Na+/H+ antiporter NhaC
MVAGWIVGLIISLIFGGICAVSINKYISYRITASGNERVTKITDELFFSDLES